MSKHRKLLLPLAFGAALVLSACGGGGDDASVQAQPDTEKSATAALIDYMLDLIATTDENADLVDVNALTLAVDDTVEPTPL